MSLIVNKLAATKSSKGVYRFFTNVIDNLNWDSKIEYIESTKFKMLDSVLDLSRNGVRKDIFWTPCLKGPLRVPNHIITVHDCINIEFVYKNDWRLFLFKQIIQKIIDNSVKIVAISESTKKSFLKNYHADDAKVVVIKSASNFDWVEKERLRQNKLISDYPPYVLMVTNRLLHKNNLKAIKALVKSNCKKYGIELRVVGEIGRDECNLLHKNGMKFYVDSYVNDGRLFQLYSNALFLFSSSLSEGHNLPIGEALKSGANVLCSDIPAHREFYDGMVDFFDPYDLEGMIHSVNTSLNKNGLWHLNKFDLSRNFLDVADDYRKLFMNVRREYCK